MSGAAVKITLREGERIFLGQAVFRADRRTVLEILNDVPYLREHQIIQIEQTTTPLRQLYFVVQTMIIDPQSTQAHAVFTGMMIWMVETYANMEILNGLTAIKANVDAGKPFEGIKILRTLLPVEDEILGISRTNDVILLEAV